MKLKLTRLISSGMTNLKDVMHVIAWKMDRVKQKETEDYPFVGNIMLTVEDTETGLIQNRQGKKIDCSNLANVILHNITNFVD